MKQNNSNEHSQSPAKSDPYCLENVPLFEAIYGKNLISLGGLPAIENMFSDLSINGLKALDLGFGLGGVAFYLAEHYKMNITGIEVHPWMVQYAHEHTPKECEGLLEFNTYNDIGELQYSTETFDLVYSKGVLNHISNKAPLLRQIYSVLKINGLFVIADWIYPHAVTDSSVPLVCETKETYHELLANNGFSEITFRDDSKIFLSYAEELLKKLTDNQDYLVRMYGREIVRTIQNQHEHMIEQLNQHQKYAVRIVAKKVKRGC